MIRSLVIHMMNLHSYLAKYWNLVKQWIWVFGTNWILERESQEVLS